jgi:thiol-disulfide isomerase/thioredoxin
MKKIPLFLAACAALVTIQLGAQPAAATVPTSAPSHFRGPQAGEMAPDFTVVAPDGKQIKLSDFRGKTVLVDIWATWCGPCVASMPHNSALAEKHAKDGLVVLAVCADDSRANYDGWVKRNSDKYKFLTAHDPAGKDDWDNSVFNKQYGVSGFPTLYLIDKTGRIVGSTAGGGPDENPHLLRLLAKGGVPVDTSHLPPEEVGGPKSVPMVGKTMAMPAGGKTAAMVPPTVKFGNLKFDDEVADFAAIGVDGQEVKLSSFKGKPVLIAFWTGARNPGDDFAKLQATYKDQGLAVWAINVATDRAEFDTWAKANAAALGYTVSWDPAGKAVMESLSYMKFGIGMYPAFMVVNAKGFFRGGLIGMGPKVAGWMRESLMVADLKLNAEDKAAMEQVMNEMLAAREKAAAAPAGGMMAAATIAPMAGGDAVTAAQKIPTLAAGAIAPDFSMRDIAGKEIRLSDFKGKVIVLDFWATWCGPCISSFPHTQEIAAKYKDQDVIVLAAGTSDTIAKFQEWIPKNQPKYPDLRFAYDLNERETLAFEERASAKLYHVVGIPTQFVIGRDGKITGVVVGNEGMGDARTEFALAAAGVKVDAAIVAQGQAQVAKEAQASAATAAKPTAPFREGYGKLKAGNPVPDFTVITPEGKEAKFSDYAKGKTVVLDFWATWCGPCQKAMPHYEEIQRKYADKGVVILGVCGFDTRANYDKWLVDTKGKYTFATVFDPVGKPAAGDKEAMGRTVMMQLSQGALTPLPTTLVINAAGKLVGSYVGYGEGTHAGLANLLMLAGVELANEDKPKIFFPAGSTLKAAMPAATTQAMGGAPAAAPKPVTLGAGAVAPDFLMHDINDKEVRLSDFKGKVVILDFWATWCGPCIASMPHTNELAAKYADQDVVVLASGTSDLIAKFKDWIPKNQPKYPHLRFAFDLNERDSATFENRPSSKLYGVTGIPTQFVIGRDGKITATIVGNGGKEDARTEAALARAGVKVDPTRVEAGEKQLKAAAEEEANRIAAAKEEEKNPTPKFRVSFGKLNQGQPVPDFTAEAPDGAAVKFSELTKDKATVFMVWSARGGPTAAALEYVEGWAKRYADQGVLFVGLAAYGAREDFAKWHAANGAKISFPVLFDPAGLPPTPTKTMEEMTEAERTAFREASRAHYAKVIPMAFLGGVMAPVPNNVVIDAKGNFLGFYVGAGPGAADSLGNLLLRAGVKLKPEDMPKKVFSAEETKEKPPEAKVEMLKIGAAAPDFPATDAAGKAVKVSDYRGKVVILDFWATWCGPCLASMPHTQEVAAHYKDQGVVVLASCTSDARAKFDGWVKANQPLYPDINFSHDPQERGADRASHKLYGVGGIPQQFIIDRDGKVAALVTGYLKGEAILDAALAKAGIKVDPALIEKAALDLKKREMMR